MNMNEAGYHPDQGEGNEGKDDEVAGRRSIGRAIEESLSLKMKSRHYETKDVARKRIDEISDSMVKEEGFRVESSEQIDLFRRGGGRGRGRGELKINGKGKHVEICVGETSENASLALARQPSIEEATSKAAAEKLNLEKTDSELEAYILDKLSFLQPSFRTLFEPSVESGTTSSTFGPNSDDIKTEQEATTASATAGGKSKWKKKIEGVISKVTSSSSSGKKQQQSSDTEGILYETDVRGILKMRWEEEKKKCKVKQRRKWPKSCICCPRTNSTGKNMKEWEFQLEEYSSTW